MDRASILQALEATGWVIEGERGAALMLNVHPASLRHRMKRLGIVRAVAPVVVETHPPAAPMLGKLARLRAHARLIRSTYLDTPSRAAMLRANEAEQRAVLVALRALLGEQPVCGGVRAGQAPGVLRPAWSQRW
jgi:hypothetical protein